MKNFLKIVVGSALGLFLVLLIVALGFAGMSAPEAAQLNDNSILLFDMGLSIRDRNVIPSPKDMFFNQGEISESLRGVLDGLEAAAVDEKIAALHLHGRVSGLGASSQRALHQGILDFRRSGKPVLAYAPGFDDATYYLSSAADSIYVPPMMEVALDGYAAEVTYYADALEMLGVEMQVTRVGKYKSAVEPFLLSQMSEPNREQLENFLGDITDVMHADIARARGWTDAEFAAILANGGLFTGEDAVAEGLLTGVRYADEIFADFRGFTGTDDEADPFPKISFDDYLSLQSIESEDVDSTQPHVAVIYAEGEIVDGQGNEGVAGDSVAKLIRKARLDKDVAAIVLRVNSPGGSAAASEVILREVILSTEVKPVVVSMGDYAASGGYWISSRANYILAEPNTITGSIGVFGMFPNAQKLMQRFGLNVETVRTGPYADMFSLNRPRTDEELAIVQKWVDSIYDGFLDRVALGRDMTREAVHEIAQGRVWSGKAALELGLVDALGDLNDAIEVAASRAHLEGDYGVVVIEQEYDAFSQFMAELMAASPLEIPTTEVVRDAARTLDWVGQMRGIQARLPYLVRLH